uniref:Uncharacterized protein n=1 Tax=Arundo donax TaxID=35708 RepID=A0A0A8ZPU7_ARUDO
MKIVWSICNKDICVVFQLGRQNFFWILEQCATSVVTDFVCRISRSYLRGNMWICVRLMASYSWLSTKGTFSITTLGYMMSCSLGKSHSMSYQSVNWTSRG